VPVDDGAAFTGSQTWRYRYRTEIVLCVVAWAPEDVIQLVLAAIMERIGLHLYRNCHIFLRKCSKWSPTR